MVTQLAGPTKPGGSPDRTVNPATFTWNATGGGIAGSAECSLDGGATFAVCTGSDATSAIVNLGPPPPPDGVLFHMQIRTRNAAGLSAAAPIDWQFNPMPATISVDGLDPPTNSTATPFRPLVTVNGGAVHLTCIVDPTTPPALQKDPVACGPTDARLDAVTGTHTLRVIATNASGTFIPPDLTFTYS